MISQMRARYTEERGDNPPTKAFAGAKRKGYEAAINGSSKDACPYQDKRGGKYAHVVTFSRAYRNWWFAGWEQGNTERMSEEE